MDNKEKLLEQTLDIYDVDSYIKEISEGIEESFWFKEIAIFVARSGNGCFADYESIGKMFSSTQEEIAFDINEPDPERPNVIYLRPVGQRKIKIQDIIDHAHKKQVRGREFFDKCLGYNMRCEDNFQELLEYLDKIGYFKENLDAGLITEERSDDIYDFIEDLYDLRKESIAKEGEYGLGNLIFKEFRNKGYLDNLKELRKQEKSKELSLENLSEEPEDETTAFEKELIETYRKYANIDENFEITEENINKWALDRTSCFKNYDVNDLRELLLRR